jgi:hypothetical protein
VIIDRGKANRSADARRHAAIDSLAVVRKIVPYLDGIHETEAEGPEECYWLLMASLITYSYAMQWRVGRYRDWLDTLTEDQWDGAYREYLAILHILDGGTADRHWVLKCPLHAPRVDTLARLLPDAIFVQTYRDIRESTASLCSLTAALRAMSSDTWDPTGDGRDVLAGLARSSRAAIEAASRHPDRMIDVHYHDLVRDPVGTAHHIYERAGLSWTAEIEAGMRRQMATGRRAGTRRHQYSLDDFGLTESDIMVACPEYIDTEQRMAAARR